MVDFLDPQLRELAMAAHEKLWQRRGDPDRPKMSKSRHRASDYLLSGLLFARQDDGKLVGILCGRVDKKVRYYRHKRGRRGYIKGSIFNRMLPAKPLEDAIISAVQNAFANGNEMRQKITNLIVAESQREGQESNLADLCKQRDRIKGKIRTIVSTLDEETLADVQPEIERLKAERDHLSQQIAAAEANSQLRLKDPQALCEQVLANLQNLADSARSVPTFAFRQWLETVIEKIVVDMETKSVELRLKLPIGTAISSENNPKAMRLVGTSPSSTSYQTHREMTIPFAVFACEWQIRSSRACYECRRRAA